MRAQIKKLSEELKLSEEAILIELKKYQSGLKNSSYSFVRLDSEPGNVKAEKILIGCMLEDEEIAQNVLKKLKVEDFSVLLHRQILEVMIEILKDDKKIRFSKSY